MTLNDIYTQLSFGELRGLFTPVDSAIDTPLPMAAFRAMLPSVALGLIELFKRFCLIEGTLSVTLVPGQASYVLGATDLNKVERIYGTYYEEEYDIPLNMVDDPKSIRTTSYNTLLVPTDAELAPWLSETPTLRVVYRAGHPPVAISNNDNTLLGTTILLPSTHLEPLLYYVASRVKNPMGMTPGALHEGNNYMVKFENACALLQSLNYEIDQDSQSDKFSVRGFC